MKSFYRQSEFHLIPTFTRGTSFSTPYGDKTIWNKTLTIEWLHYRLEIIKEVPLNEWFRLRKKYRGY